MHRKIWLVAALALLSFGLVATGCGGSDSDEDGSGTFRVGLEAPLSGEQAVLGEGGC